MYEVSFDHCKCSLLVCLECISVSEKQPDCFKCRTKDMKKCYQCESLVDLSKKDAGKKITFSNCPKKTCSATVCKTCFQKGYQKLISTPDSNQHVCYLCLNDLEKTKSIRYTDNLNCSGSHKIILCGDCQKIFSKVKKRCPICDPFEMDAELCVACYYPTKDSMSILPVSCNSHHHKFNICIDCASSLTQPTFICRLCNLKDNQNYVFMQTVEDNQDSLCLPSLRFMSNKISKDSIEIDKYLCPECEPVSVKLNLISSSDENSNTVWFPMFASVAKFGTNFLVSGGIDMETGSSVASSMVVKLDKAGFIPTFQMNNMGMLKKSRHAHGSFYHEKEKNLYVIGGAEKKGNSNTVDYLNSIECFDILDPSQHFDTHQEWNTTMFKLKRARCCFSQLQMEEKLIIFGGFSGVGKIEPTIEIIDFHKKTVLFLDMDKNYTVPIYPVLFKNDQDSILVVGGFQKEIGVNSTSHIVSLKYPKSTPVPNKGIQVSDKLRSINAFGTNIIFGGNNFEKTSDGKGAQFRSSNNDFFGVIDSGYKSLKSHSIDSIKQVLDCFNGGQFDFNNLID